MNQNNLLIHTLLSVWCQEDILILSLIEKIFEYVTRFRPKYSEPEETVKVMKHSYEQRL